MQLQAEQIIFGSDARGYRILGHSVGATAFCDEFAKICSSFGPQDISYSGEPFLFNKVIGESVLMACGRSGAKDSAGRKTLFFSGLILPSELSKKTGATPFTLFERRLFKEGYNGEVLERLTEDLEAIVSVPNSPSIKCPSVIIGCDKPMNNLLKEMLGSQANSLNWASYSFCPLDNFDIYALSKSASLPDDNVNRYDLCGKPIAYERHNEKSDMQYEENSDISRKPVRSKPRILTIASILLNFILLFALYHLSSRGNDAKIENINDVDEKTLSSAGEVEEHKFQRYPDLPKDKIEDLRTEAQDDSKYQLFCGILKNKDQAGKFRNDYELFLKLEAYVQFVNNNFLNNKEYVNE